MMPWLVHCFVSEVQVSYVPWLVKNKGEWLHLLSTLCISNGKPLQTSCLATMLNGFLYLNRVTDSQEPRLATQSVFNKSGSLHWFATLTSGQRFISVTSPFPKITRGKMTQLSLNAEAVRSKGGVT